MGNIYILNFICHIFGGAHEKSGGQCPPWPIRPDLIATNEMKEKLKHNSIPVKQMKNNSM